LEPGYVNIDKEKVLKNWVSEEISKAYVVPDKNAELIKQRQDTENALDLVKPKFLNIFPHASRESYQQQMR